MIRWQSFGPLWSGYLGNVVVVDAFDGGDGASWTARGMQLGRGQSPHTVIVSSIEEAKAASEAYVEAWLEDAGMSQTVCEGEIWSMAADIIVELDDPNFHFDDREVTIVADLLRRRLLRG